MGLEDHLLAFSVEVLVLYVDRFEAGLLLFGGVGLQS